MATPTFIFNPSTIVSKPAGADLSAHQGKFVKESTGTIVICGTLGELPLGILQNKPLAGESAEVLIEGGDLVKVDGVIGEGVQITTDAAGLATPALATHFVVGRMVQAAATANTFIECQIDCVNATIV